MPKVGGVGGGGETEGFKWLVHKLEVFIVVHKVKNPNWPETNQLAILQACSRI